METELKQSLIVWVSKVVSLTSGYRVGSMRSCLFKGIIFLSLSCPFILWHCMCCLSKYDMVLIAILHKSGIISQGSADPLVRLIS